MLTISFCAIDFIESVFFVLVSASALAQDGRVAAFSLIAALCPCGFFVGVEACIFVVSPVSDVNTAWLLDDVNRAECAAVSGLN